MSIFRSKSLRKAAVLAIFSVRDEYACATLSNVKIAEKNLPLADIEYAAFDAGSSRASVLYFTAL